MSVKQHYSLATDCFIWTLCQTEWMPVLKMSRIFHLDAVQNLNGEISTMIFTPGEKSISTDSVMTCKIFLGTHTAMYSS